MTRDSVNDIRVLCLFYDFEYIYIYIYKGILYFSSLGFQQDRRAYP